MIFFQLLFQLLEYLAFNLNLIAFLIGFGFRLESKHITLRHFWVLRIILERIVNLDYFKVFLEELEVLKYSSNKHILLSLKSIVIIILSSCFFQDENPF